MKEFFLVRYTYKDLDEVGLRELTKKFGEFGVSPGTVAHYVNLDGSGGFVILSAQTEEERAKGYEITIEYGPWVDFEITPVATMDEALPIILKVYG